MTLEHPHTPEAIRDRLAAGPRPSYIRDWVYGGVDGAVTTFAIVSGVVGAGYSTDVIVILGIANLVGDGFSMAAGNYLGTRSEQQQYQHLEAMEHRHIETMPEGEREEVRQIYRVKGFDGEQLEMIVDGITSDREQWVRTMLTEEHGQPLEIRSPRRAALATFSAFMLCGLVPLVPYLVGSRDGFALSALLTGVVFFIIGSAKSRWSVTSWWWSGALTLAVGAVAAALAFGLGRLLSGLIGG